MTIQDVKKKYQIDVLSFRETFSATKVKTNWFKASNETNSIFFLIHKNDIDQIKLYPKRQDINIESTRKYDTKGNFLFDGHIITLGGLVTKVKLFEEEEIITIIPKLKCVKLNRIEDLENEFKKPQEVFLGLDEQVREKIALEYEVDFRIQNFSWKIPYVVILEKIYLKNQSTIKFIYRKCRSRLKKISDIEIVNDHLYTSLIHSLLLLDRINIELINYTEFEKSFENKSFFFYHDIKYNSNLECIYIISKTFYKKWKDNFTNINLRRNEQISFEESKFFPGELILGIYYLNLFPIGFFDSYIENYINNQGKITDLYQYSNFDKSFEAKLKSFNTNSARSQGEKIFEGNYEECLNFLETKQNIINIEREIGSANMMIRQISSYENPNSESDYFDAMTDGQLGSYDDFIDNGGDIDYLT